MLQKTVNMAEVAGLSWTEEEEVMIHGYDEDGAVIFLSMSSAFFMVQLDSMKFTNLRQGNLITADVSLPYRNFLC